MADVYKVLVKSWADGWELHVEGVGVTQTPRRLPQAEDMVRDLIARRKEVRANSFDLEWSFEPVHWRSVSLGDLVYVYDMGIHHRDRPKEGWPGTVVAKSHATAWISHQESASGEAFSLSDGRCLDAAVRLFRTVPSVNAEILRGEATEAAVPKADTTHTSSVRQDDEVRVYDVNGDPQGWPGTVTKVGHTLVHISYGPSWKVTQEFSLQTGQASGNDRWYRTLDAVRLGVRRTTALAVLHAVGLDEAYRGGPTPTLEVLEAAALAVMAYMPEPKED